MKGKEKIVNAAIKLFNKNSVYAVTTNHIAEDIGISPGNLYYHFRNKEAIIFEIYQGMIRYMDDVWVKPVTTSPIATVADKINRTMNLQYRYRFFYREIGNLIDKDPALKEVYIQNRERRCKEMTEYFAFMEQEGIFDFTEDIEQIRVLVEIIWYLSELWLQHGMITGVKSVKQMIMNNKSMIRMVVAPYINEQYRELLIF